MTKVFVVYGIPDNDMVTIELNEGEVGKLSPFLDGTNVVGNLLSKDKFIVQNIILGGANENLNLKLQKPDVIYNAMCNADNQHKSMKSFDEKFLNLGIPVVNHPDGIRKSARELIYENCKNNKNFTIPKTKRIKPKSVKEVFSLAKKEGFDFPFIFRTVADNNAINMELISSEDDAYKLEQFAFNGSEFYMIEFIDYKSKDDIYRKYRLLVIDGKAIVRHLQISDNWKVDFFNHTRMIKENLQISEESEKFINTPISKNVQKMVDILYKYLKLDFFGIDYFVDKNDNVLMFEANSCMKPFLILKDRPEYFNKRAEEVRVLLEKIIINK